MWSKNTRAISLLLATSAAFLSGCGGDAYRPVDDVGNTGGGLAPGGAPVPPITPGGSTTIPDVSFDPAISFTINKLTGSNGVRSYFPHPDATIADDGYDGTLVHPLEEGVLTDSILKVKISALPAAQNSLPVGTTNFNGAYTCISYSVTALGQTQQTGLLAVNGGGPGCQGAPTSKVLDFSSRLTAGHGPVPITVRAVNYDFYCNMWSACQAVIFTGAWWDPQWQMCSASFPPNSYSFSCPVKTVYQNHTVKADIAIQVNGTVAP